MWNDDIHAIRYVSEGRKKNGQKKATWTTDNYHGSFHFQFKNRTFGKSHSVSYDANDCSLFSMTMRKGFMSILTFISWYCPIKLSFVRLQKYEWMCLLFDQLSPECFATLALPQWACAGRKYYWIKLNWQKNAYFFHVFSLADFSFSWQWKRTWKMLLIFV